MEIWAAEVALELKETYPNIKLGILLPYEGFADSWNETNRMIFEKITLEADYVNATSSQSYQNPGQLKGNQEFILRNTDGTLLFYEMEKEGKPQYLYDLILRYQEVEPYELELISFDELEWFVREYEETHREDFF